MKQSLAPSKNIYIETLGCSKNQVDSDRVERFLQAQGFTSVAPEQADFLILNTCGFIQAAVEESLDRILDLADYKKDEQTKLVMMGCLSQRYQDDLSLELPEVDLFVGTGYLEQMDEVLLNPTKRFYLDQRDAAESTHLFPLVSSPSYSYIKIAEGCDNFCTYCIIPQLRGPFRSRSIESIVREAKEVSAQGIKEIILIAQDTSRFGVDQGTSLLELLTELNQVEGIEWIRLQYLYPDILDRTFFETIKQLTKVVPYFDIPIQHVSNPVLKRMNRHTTKENLIEVVSLAREILPEATLRTTVIVGFPGETEDEFQELLSFVKEHPFDKLGAFMYSDEPESASYKLSDKVDQATKQRRLDRLMAVQQAISESLLERRVGQVLEVMVDVGGKQPIGRTRFDAPEVDGVVDIQTEKKLKKGTIVAVRITDSTEHDLIGEVV